jgi:hypothetical protein
VALTPRWAWFVVTAALAAVLALVVARPHQMVSPGDLIPAHASLQQDCFACHAPFRGVSAERCQRCHVVADIGRRTTRGVPIAWKRPPFHQALTTRDCAACHTDHPRPRLTRNLDRPFDHALLRAELRDRCADCHAAPPDPFHRDAGASCGQCHTTRGWTPATFDHERYFSLAPPHHAACATCHVNRQYGSYTCFGCHEHRPDRIEAKHREEGIRDVRNCVRCHRGADDERGEGAREGRRHEREDDE